MENEYEMLRRALIELDSHIEVYKNRAQILWKGANPERYERDIPINFCPCCMQAFEGRI